LALINAGTKAEQHIADYMRSIHPTRWSIFGNRTLGDNDKAYTERGWGEFPAYGSPKPLLRVRTTSVIEGENNALLWNNLRNSLVPEGFYRFCLRVMSVV
ncbi:hypothetical protein PHYSODRAFT_449267, partial [Phytophthora sojae]